jgi:hypothetical protein
MEDAIRQLYDRMKQGYTIAQLKDWAKTFYSLPMRDSLLFIIENFELRKPSYATTNLHTTTAAC